MTWHARLDSPIGKLTLVKTRDGLSAITTEGQAPPRIDASAREDATAFGDEARQLEEYFAGERTRFDLALAPDPGGTPFQRDVWSALLEIPFGSTRSYVDIARAIGKPHGSRAVGAANARNPISIIVPCHRVIGSSGDLIGYAGGLPRKKWLLAHESCFGSGHLRRYTLMMGTPSCAST